MDDSRYIIPIELLPEQAVDHPLPNDDIERIKQGILAVLNKYGIGVESINTIISPSVITIEAIPPQGYKVSGIRKYVDDIERDLKEHGLCRVVVPVPGKGTLAVEIPRSDPQMVRLRRLLESDEYLTSQAELPITLGISTENKPIIADLRKMPHLLIGGAIGLGKSVLLHSMIVSLLYRKSPDEVKFLLIDPKMVELTNYIGISNQYLVKIEGIDKDVITEPESTIIALNSLCVEMEKRYELLRKYGCRSSREYNQKLKYGKLAKADGHRPMPYIVAVIDEIAELMVACGKEFETPLARLAQKSRAAGIHLIIATQKPSTKIITGIIKANFPARIAFKVQNIDDSRTILDMSGAQRLTGMGDMLVRVNGQESRVQGTFVAPSEIEKVSDWIAHNNSCDNHYILLVQLIKTSIMEDSNSIGTDDMIKRIMLRHKLSEEEAIEIINIGIQAQQARERQEQYLKMAIKKLRDKAEVLTLGSKEYRIIGDTSEVQKINDIMGIINIDTADIERSLNSTGVNFVFTATSVNCSMKEVLAEAWEQYHHICPIGKILFNIWINPENTKPSLAEMQSVVDYSNSEFGYYKADVIWGLAYDKSLNNKIKVTLIASSK